MSEECNGNCSGCGEECQNRSPESFLESPHELSAIKKVIGVVSGKGGVGKTLVTSLLAAALRRDGYNTAILDADITGPSVPRAFGITEKAQSDELGIFPVKSKTGIMIMSTNLILPNETDPVVWRGPVIAGAVKQFWTDVIWGDIDYMFIDLPPGTGDVPLTVFQSIPLDGIVIVSSPQELVGMIVEKAVNMAAMMDIPILALVENMSYYECPDCGKRHSVFGESHADGIASAHGIDTVCKMPVNRSLAAAADAGTIEQADGGSLYALVEKLKKMEEK